MKKAESFKVEIVNEVGKYLGSVNIPAKDAKALIEILGIDSVKNRLNGVWDVCFLLWLSYMLHLFVYHDLAGDLKEGYDYICARLYKALERKEKKNV